MLRTSCKVFIRQCHEQGLIGDQKRKDAEWYIMQEKVHCELRNLLMMVLVPRPLHEDSDRQAAYLRATVSRVISFYNLKKLLDFYRLLIQL